MAGNLKLHLLRPGSGGKEREIALTSAPALMLQRALPVYILPHAIKDMRWLMGNTFHNTINLKNKTRVSENTKQSRYFVDAASYLVPSSVRANRNSQSRQEPEACCMERGARTRNADWCTVAGLSIRRATRWSFGQ